MREKNHASRITIQIEAFGAYLGAEGFCV